MNIQEVLYKKAERKLVIWSVIAMLIMSASFVGIAYFMSIRQLEQNEQSIEQSSQRLPATIQEIEQTRAQAKQNLISTLLIGQGAVLCVGIAGATIFARKTLAPIRRAHKAQAEFAANVNHQLRTPIAIVQAEIETALLRPQTSKQKHEEVLRAVLEETSSLRKISEHLLTYAETDMDVNAVRATSKDVLELCETMQQRYRVAATPRVESNLHLNVNKQDLYLILDILFDNTRKHSGKSKEDISVFITLQKTNKKVIFVYSDNGKGIAKSEEAGIFRRGYRSASRTTSGNGIGLAVVNDLVRAHKGTVRAATHDSGFAVTIEFP